MTGPLPYTVFYLCFAKVVVSIVFARLFILEYG